MSFVVAVGLEHLLVPRLDPATHMISEYANTKWRGVMVVGFVAWGVSLGLTTVLANGVGRPGASRWPGRVLVGWLMLATVGAVVTASYDTQTSEGMLPRGVKLTLGGRLHDLGSGAITLGILGAALAAVVVIDRPTSFRRWTIAVVLFAVGVDVGLLTVGPSVGGLRQRLLIAAGCLWQASLIVVLRRMGRRTKSSAVLRHEGSVG